MIMPNWKNAINFITFRDSPDINFKKKTYFQGWKTNEKSDIQI